MNPVRDIGLIEINLLEERGEELRRLVVEQILPEVLTAIDDAAVAQVKQVGRHQRRLGVGSQDVDVFALGGRDLLLLLHLFDGRGQVAQRGGFLKTRVDGGLLHPRAQALDQILQASFQEQTHIAHRRGVLFVRSETFDAWPQAAMDVILQARMRMEARQVHFAGRNLEVAMNEMHQPMRQVAGKIGAEIAGAVLDEPPRHVHARIFFISQLDVRKRLVVAQQDVEARLPLLDQVVLERQRFLVVVDQDVLDVARFRDQRAGFDVG